MGTYQLTIRNRLAVGLLLLVGLGLVGALLAVGLALVIGLAAGGAVLGSGHPLLGRTPWFVHLLGGRITLMTEFTLLLAALLLAATGWPWLAWVYLGYSALNALGAWLILTRRV